MTSCYDYAAAVVPQTRDSLGRTDARQKQRKTQTTPITRVYYLLYEIYRRLCVRARIPTSMQMSTLLSLLSAITAARTRTRFLYVTQKINSTIHLCYYIRKEKTTLFIITRISPCCLLPLTPPLH